MWHYKHHCRSYSTTLLDTYNFLGPYFIDTCACGLMLQETTFHLFLSRLTSHLFLNWLTSNLFLSQPTSSLFFTWQTSSLLLILSLQPSWHGPQSTSYIIRPPAPCSSYQPLSYLSVQPDGLTAQDSQLACSLAPRLSAQDLQLISPIWLPDSRLPDPLHLPCLAWIFRLYLRDIWKGGTICTTIKYLLLLKISKLVQHCSRNRCNFKASVLLISIKIPTIHFIDASFGWISNLFGLLLPPVHCVQCTEHQNATQAKGKWISKPGKYQPCMGAALK